MFSVDICSEYPRQNLATSSKVSASAGMSRSKQERSSLEFSLRKAATLADFEARSSYMVIKHNYIVGLVDKL